MTEKMDKEQAFSFIKKYVLLFLAAVLVLLGTQRTVHAEQTAKGRIIMSIEKSTIGQGFIMEPQYVDFYEGDTLATITLRELTKLGRRYNYDGNLKNGFYL